MKNKFKIDEVVYVSFETRILISKIIAIQIENETEWVWYRLNGYDRWLSEERLCNDPSLIGALRKAEA